MVDDNSNVAHEPSFLQNKFAAEIVAPGSHLELKWDVGRNGRAPDCNRRMEIGPGTGEHEQDVVIP